MGYLHTCTFVLSVTALFYVLKAIVKPKRSTDPPGPKPLPFIGNILDFPLDKPWETYAKWKEQYGDIIYMNLLGTPMVVLNSLNACTDLLEKRSARYSGRPRLIMLGELMGVNYTFSTMDYGPRWRNHRRIFHQSFNENESSKYRPTQERYTHLFLQRLLTEPDSFLSHARRMFGETTLDIVYDIKAEDNNTLYIKIAEKAVSIALDAVIPGRFLVDVFPLLKYIPAWFPGANFKRLAAKWRQTFEDMKDLVFDYAVNKVERGNAGPSVLMSMLERLKEEQSEAVPKDDESPEDVAKNCAAIAYLAGADTTLSTIQTFFMIMANHRDVQLAAQKELDAVLGNAPNRLPGYADQPQLPIVTAITQEMLRWHNAVPMGVPHVLTEDDEYNGYHLHKGTVILPNIWHILRDPEAYPDPFTFNPRRWLINSPEGPKINPNVPDPTAVFGFGRRICPGRHFALNALFITIASVLACFNIQPLDAQGRSAEHVDEVFTGSLVTYPGPYKVSIKPRSSHLAQLIRDLGM